MESAKAVVSHRLQTPITATWWIGLILTLGAIRVAIALIIIPDQAVTPDEGLYVEVLQALLAGRNITDVGNELGYGPNIFTGNWVFLRTAQIVSVLGLSAWDALRLASIIFSTLTALAVLDIILRARRSRRPGDRPGIPLLSAAGLALLVLLLMPSSQIWGSIGLRDASAVLSFTLAAWGLSFLVLQRQLAAALVGLVGVFLGITGVYLSRSYLALMLTAAIVLAIVLPPIKGRLITITAAIVLAFFANLVGADIRAQAPPPTEANQATEASETTETTETTEPSPVIDVVDSRVSNFYTSRLKFQKGAGSAFASNYCAPPRSVVSTATCELVHLPLGLYRYLLTPNVMTTGLEVPRQRLFAGFENLLWFVLFAAAFLTLVGRYEMSRRMTVFLVAFLLITSVAYALISGNEGTAFRHKGQFLWAWCLLIALGYGWRPWVRSLLPAGRAHAKADSETQ